VKFSATCVACGNYSGASAVASQIEIRNNTAALTADIVSAFVTSNSVEAADLPGLIFLVHQTFVGLLSPAPPEAAKPIPAVPVKKSITPDHILSLEDGKPYKSLKRHLSSRGLTPAEYRAKWGLPSNYPMVSPNYAKARSELAKSLGLGQQRRKRAEHSLTKQLRSKVSRPRRETA
jgi:predicted transcriptional regulator